MIYAYILIFGLAVAVVALEKRIRKLEERREDTCSDPSYDDRIRDEGRCS